MVTVLNDNNFQTEVLDVKDTPVMVDFWAEWCGPCRLLSPILDEVVKGYEGKVKYAKMETDESPNTPMQYGIMSIPTIIIFKDGKELKRIVGLQPKEEFQKALNDIL